MIKPIEQFDPYGSKYKKIEDLPRGERKKFKKAEGGFVRVSAEENAEAAMSLAEVQASYMEDILRYRKEGKEHEAGILEEEMAAMLKAIEEEQ